MEEEYERKVAEWKQKEKLSWQDNLVKLNSQLKEVKLKKEEEQKSRKPKVVMKIVKKRKVEEPNGEIRGEERPSG